MEWGRGEVGGKKRERESYMYLHCHAVMYIIISTACTVRMEVHRTSLVMLIHIDHVAGMCVGTLYFWRCSIRMYMYMYMYMYICMYTIQ